MDDILAVVALVIIWALFHGGITINDNGHQHLFQADFGDTRIVR